jgi:DNA-binding XRE family transcriptional regulator
MPEPPAEDRAAAISLRKLLGSELATAREGTDLSQAALAKLVGYSAETLAAAETADDDLDQAFWVAVDHSLACAGHLISLCNQLQELMPDQSASWLQERSGS